jgi:membrane peptidoglycan carboxypeptidase
LDGYPAEGLGGLRRGVTPLELARAYATLANGGNRLEPTAIHRVDLPSGTAQQLDAPTDDQLFKDGETYAVTRILQQNIKRGTGQAAKIGCPAAGKTGTTDDFRDAWFAGYTPRVSTVVWVGYPHRSVPMLNVHGIKVAGATFPAQIWHDYMAVAKRGFCGKFPKPLELSTLKPYCARLTVTRNCEPPPGQGDEQQSPLAPQPAPTTTTPPPAPIPDTLILAGPPAHTIARDAQFRFRAAVGPKAKAFECSVDAGPFTVCRSPVDFAKLDPGEHAFSVRAVSPDGAPDASPATFRWIVYSDLQPSAPRPPPAEPQAKKKPPEKPPVIVG